MNNSMTKVLSLIHQWHEQRLNIVLDNGVGPHTGECGRSRPKTLLSRAGGSVRACLTINTLGGSARDYIGVAASECHLQRLRPPLCHSEVAARNWIGSQITTTDYYYTLPQLEHAIEASTV